MTARTKTPAIERLLAKVTKTDTCWLFIGANNGRGYGILGDENRKMCYVHRLMYVHTKGPIPDGLEVRHSCDVRNCVNPDHLLLGTHQQNVADMVVRGRSSRGERQWNAKLTEDGVRSIRNRVANGERRAALADEHQVSIATIDLIVTRKRWKHVA